MAKPSRRPAGDGETVSSYFRRIFEERPDLLAGGSNDELFLRWLKDHPGEKEVPKRIKANLFTIKSVLRAKQRRKPGRPKKQEAKPAEATATTAFVAARTPRKGLEALEVHIDDALTMAKNIDREGLGSVIDHLRRARNEVVWKMGQ